ncbi:MAG: hypothetical protein NDI60_02670 [Elusimicrobiales bacterium]|nr:hypothetical protein [Elusimicrobiales bacterium]
MKRTITALLAALTLAPAAYAELREIDSIACHMQPGRCIQKGTGKTAKFYIDWTAADQAAMDKHAAEYKQSSEKSANYLAAGGNATIGNCGLWDKAAGRPYAGTDALFKKYNLSGQCEIGGQTGDMDCYVSQHCVDGAMLKKFAHITDPVRRVDTGITDSLAFDAYMNTQPRYFCSSKSGVCVSCRMVINGKSQDSSCEDGFSKQITNRQQLDKLYLAWKNPFLAAPAEGAAAAPAGAKKLSNSGNFVPLNEKPEEGEPRRVIIGGSTGDVSGN